jgi:hypothetical protein
MLLGDPKGSCVVLEAQLERYSDGSVGTDLWISVDVRLSGFSAEIASCVARSDWNAFLRDLSHEAGGQAE